MAPAASCWREHKLPTTLLINSELYEAAPQLIAAYRAQGAEIAAHGQTNSQHQADLDETQERALIEHVSATIARHEGRPPAGWLSPWIAETERTPDLLHEAGYQLRAGLVHGRPAGVAEDAPGPPAVGALPAGAQRQRRHHRPPGRRRRVRRHDRRPVRGDAPAGARNSRW